MSRLTMIDTTTAAVEIKRYCKQTGQMCELATDFGYCQLTACSKQKCGDVLPLEVTNKCDNPFSVGTGLIFNADGQYLVTVYGRKIIVEKSAKVKHSKWDNTCSCKNCGCQPWYSGDIHSLKYCPNCGAKMDL